MSLHDIGQSLLDGNNHVNNIERKSANELKTVSTNPKEEELVLNGSKLADYIEINEDDLTFFERCGRGSYGSVYRGLWKSRNKIVAIKKLLQLDNNEAEILSSCSHRNIIQFYGIVSKAETTLNYCIITEYADYGSLQTFISQHDLYNEYGLELILKWVHDIALGMNYLHSEAPIKIIHRDLKSNNVLITYNKHEDEYTCKICDFGSSKWGIQTTKMTITGTFPWMSPEIIQSKPANQSCDTWSYGVVLWELITGKVPFKGIEEFQIAFLVVEREQRLPIPSSCPQVLANLMRTCWETDPKKRPTFKSILYTLDQIDLDDKAKAEIDNQINKNKSKWEIEIEQAFERLKKIEDDLHIKEKLLEAREKRLRELEMDYITASSKLITVEEHDINSWTKYDVSEWIKKIGHKINRDGISDYWEKFLNHDINGKRLLMMTKADLRNIGILSEGHILEIYHDIQSLKLENTRLLNFPPLKQRSQSRSSTSFKTVSFTLMVGALIWRAEKFKRSQSKEENNSDEIDASPFKWKMYIDMDEYADESTKDIKLLSCIRDVKFICKNQFEQYNIGKHPFVMRHWVKNKLPTNCLKISCIVTYEEKVIQPKKSIIEYELKVGDSQPTIMYEQITLTLEDDIDNNIGINKNNNTNNNTKTACSSNTSSCTSTATNAIALITANIQFQTGSCCLTSSSSMSSSASPQLVNGENVWKKRNLENAVIIPETHVVKNSLDLWSGIVKGKYKNQNDNEPVNTTIKQQKSSSSISSSSPSPQIHLNNSLNRIKLGLANGINTNNNNHVNNHAFRQYSMDSTSSSSSISASPTPKNTVTLFNRQRHMANQSSNICSNPNKNVMLHKKGAYGFGRGKPKNDPS